MLWPSLIGALIAVLTVVIIIACDLRNELQELREKVSKNNKDFYGIAIQLAWGLEGVNYRLRHLEDPREE